MKSFRVVRAWEARGCDSMNTDRRYVLEGIRPPVLGEQEPVCQILGFASRAAE